VRPLVPQGGIAAVRTTGLLGRTRSTCSWGCRLHLSPLPTPVGSKLSTEATSNPHKGKANQGRRDFNKCLRSRETGGRVLTPVMWKSSTRCTCGRGRNGDLKEESASAGNDLRGQGSRFVALCAWACPVIAPLLRVRGFLHAGPFGPSAASGTPFALRTGSLHAAELW